MSKTIDNVSEILKALDVWEELSVESIQKVTEIPIWIVSDLLYILTENKETEINENDKYRLVRV